MRRAQSKEQFENRNKLNDLFLTSAGTFAENLIALNQSNKIQVNAFGRNVNVSTCASLSYLQGLAVTGIRCSALLGAEKLSDNLGAIKSMSRLRVPISIVVEKGAISRLSEISQLGAIVFQSFSNQDLADRILFAQVLSEKVLLPVVVLVDFEEFTSETEFPSKRESIQFFGDPDNFTGAKSVAQEIVFGNKRKRVPHWLNPDLPVSIGAKKDAKLQALELAAKDVFTNQKVQGFINETAKELESITTRKLESLVVSGNDKPKKLIFTSSKIPQSIQTDKIVAKNNIAFHQLNQLNPLPISFQDNWRKVDSISIIETFEGMNSGWLYKEIATLPFFEKHNKSNGWYVNVPDEQSWQNIITNITLEDKGLKQFWIDVPFNIDNSQFPKHQVLIQHLEREYPELNKKSLAKVNGSENGGVRIAAPVTVKKFADKGPAFTRVSRFFDDTASFYETGSNEMIADPFQAYPVMPVSSASFMPIKRGWAPEFSPQKCSDIESIIRACPHGAMPSSLLTIDAVIKAGIQQARNNGNAIGALVPQLKVWAKKAGEIALADAKKITKMGDFLPNAFENTLKIAKADDEKKATLKQEYAWTMEAIAEIPVAFTEEYFAKPEKAKPGTGEVFCLGVDPSSCTGCGTCAELCTDGSLNMNTDIQAIEKLNKVRFDQFVGLPSTADATVKKLIANKNFDSFAALMLNRELYASLSGGSPNDDLASEKSVIRMISALANFTLSGNSKELEKLLSKQTAALNNAVKKILSDSLPVTHLDSLMEVLSESSDEKLSMDLIMKQWGQQDAFKVVEKEGLQNKLELIEALKEWKWALKEGFSGVGRSSYSLVIDSSLANFSKYPWNNFTVPVVTTQKGQTAETAKGVFEGQLRHALDQIKLLRRTDLEAVNKYDPSVHNFQIAGLNWEQLTDEEKKMVPPVFILANQEILSEFATSEIGQLLNMGYPIKLFVLDNLNLNPENAASAFTANSSALWSLVSSAGCSLVRTSLKDANNMFSEMQNVMNGLNGAVFTILCPNTFSHNINPQRWRSLSHLGVNTRSFNPFVFNPLAEGNSYGSKFITDALPDVKDEWIEVDLDYEKNLEELKLKYKPTWADWAFTLNSWEAQFKPVKSTANTVLVADYIELSEEDRAKKVPVIVRVSDEKELLHYEVGMPVIETTEAVNRNFKLLREMAGLYSEFPDQLKEQVTKELSVQFEVEKKKLTAELAKEKADWEKTHIAEIKEQMKNRLMQLAQQEL